MGLSRRWRWVILGMLACTLAACDWAPLPRSRQPEDPFQQVRSRLGVREAGPLPEYTLSLQLDTATRRLLGRQQVIVPNLSGEYRNEVVLRLYPNSSQYGGNVSIGPVWAGPAGTSPAAQRLAPVISALRADGLSLVVPLPASLGPQASAQVSLTFEIDLPARAEGYALFGYSQGIWSLPDAYPLLAVHDGQLWNEDPPPQQGDALFADAALYDVTLFLPQNLTLACTGSVVSQTQAPDGLRAYRILGGPLRQFAWLASARLARIEKEVQGIRVSSYYLPGDEAAGQAALHTAAAALQVYSAAFGPYPFPEMAVVEAPLRHYGLEFAGLNLIGLDLYRERRDQLEDRVIHEVAHQWWYAQVGNDQINTPWLDEGLAEHSMSLYYREVYGESAAGRLIRERWLVPYEVAVQNGYDDVVNQPSYAFGKDYEVIVYAKAALFFEALRQQVGDPAYRALLQAYADRYRWRIATPDDFLAVAGSVSGQDLGPLYERWILSKE
jgi:hypothetical protein